jgi:hypothetical protein
MIKYKVKEICEHHQEGGCVGTYCRCLRGGGSRGGRRRERRLLLSWAKAGKDSKGTLISTPESSHANGNQHYHTLQGLPVSMLDRLLLDQLTSMNSFERAGCFFLFQGSFGFCRDCGKAGQHKQGVRCPLGSLDRAP